MTFKQTIGEYYRLTKPGIIRGNLITASAGFFLASQQDVSVSLFCAMLVGLSLIIAAACVSNNYLDRGIDKKMARTAKRALVAGRISGTQALCYATALGVLGILVLAVFTSVTALLTALVGYIAYVFVYGYYKRRSSLSTAVGSISGAIPPVVGYTAVTNQIDLAAGLLFLIVVFWQMPHFFAIAVFRLKDYAAASLPVLPVKKGFEQTRSQTILYIIGYGLSSVALTVFGYTGLIYAGIMIVVSSYWLYVALQKPQNGGETGWGKKVFFVSLLAITIQCVVIVFDALVG